MDTERLFLPKIKVVKTKILSTLRVLVLAIDIKSRILLKLGNYKRFMLKYIS